MNRYQRPEPGEWQIEEKTGKRYRMIGNIKEYEMMVTIGGIPVPESQVEAHNARMRAAEEQQRQAVEQQPRPQNCPFMSGLQTDCRREKCALFSDGCTLARIFDRPAAKDTAGLKCPFSGYNCRPDCALYKNGCAITGIKTQKARTNKNEQI